MGRGKRRPSGARKSSGWRNGLSIGAVALVIAMVIGGPLGGVVETVSIKAAVVILLLSIGIAILADILAVAATAGDETPFHAMASDKVPGSREAIIIVRHAERVNSVCGDIIGDICGTVSGVAATPIIHAISQHYPAVPTSVVSMAVIGLVAFLTIGGKAAEKGFAVRASTSVILTVGKAIYYLKKLYPASRRRGRRKRQPSSSR